MGASTLEDTKKSDYAGRKRGRKTNFERAESLTLESLTSTWLIKNFKDFSPEVKLKIALVVAPKRNYSLQP